MARVHAALRRGGQGSIDRRRLLASSGVLAGALAVAPSLLTAQGATPVATSMAAAASISFSSVINLSHSNSPATPVWPGNPAFEMETLVTVAEDGFYANLLTYHEHTGTHIDSPAHFIADGITADQIAPASLVAPLVVIDVRAAAEADEDYALSVDDILAWEAEYGQLPNGALVAMNSGWTARFGDPEAFVNLDTDGVMHYPGFSPDASAFLVNERSTVGIASDTLSQDPGNSTDFGTHVNILGAGLYGIEGIANLDTAPATGAWAFVGAPNHEVASGGPARILAVF
jgi:kynurenine formamidase